VTTDALSIATDLLHREALALDERRWDDWLALYCPDAEFWIPAWSSETRYTEDPENGISLMYIASRAQLEERVARVKSGRSAASAVLPRTAHAFANIMVQPPANGAIAVNAVATTHLFDVRRREQHVFFGRNEYRLVRDGGAWRIRRKKIVLMNDTIPTVVDFYSV
jgi:3-phenylpropionate/cinnamic acid dioxygenase small subunit